MARGGLASKLPVAGIGLFLAALSHMPSSARADETDEPRSRQAQALFDRGRELMATGKVAEGCALLAESQHLDPGGGTLLNLAVCHEKQGLLATAWTEYHDALSAAARDERADRQTLATERIRDLEPRLPRLLVTFPSDAPAGTMVKVDGANLSRVAAGAPLPIDPGSHDVSASAPGYVAWSMHLPSVDEGRLVEVKVPALVHLPPLGIGMRARLSTTSYVAGGVAIAGYLTMAVTGALALSAASSANGECDPARNYCEPSSASDATRARTLAWVSTITLGVALASTVVAIVWPRSRSSEKPAGVARLPAAGVGAPGLSMVF
jgi:hypothetical protein